MRSYNLLLPTLLLSACATLKSGSSSAPFQGTDAVAARIKEINEKFTVAGPCLKAATDPTTEKGGVLEVMAGADGKLAARTLVWEGTAGVQKCIIDAASATTITPLPGPPIGTVWTFAAPGTPPPPPPDRDPAVARAIADEQGRIANELEGSCAQRFIPPEQPTDIELAFYIMPGGKPAAVNVTDSTAKDGDFETCSQSLIAGKTLPDPRYAGPFPAKMHFHFGRLTNQL